MKYIILLLLSFELNAQCKTKIDEFTHAESVESKLQNIGAVKEVFNISDYIQCKFRRYENLKTLTFYVSGTSIQTIEKGEFVLIKFIDESIMELEVEKTIVSDYFKSSPGWYFWLTFYLNESQIAKLRTHPLKVIRIHYKDYFVSDRINDRLMDQIDCVLNAKPPKSPKVSK